MVYAKIVNGIAQKQRKYYRSELSEANKGKLHSVGDENESLSTSPGFVGCH